MKELIGISDNNKIYSVKDFFKRNKIKITLSIIINNNIIAKKIIEMFFCPVIDMRLCGRYINAKVISVTYIIEDKGLYVNLESVDPIKSDSEVAIADVKRNMELDGWMVTII